MSEGLWTTAELKHYHRTGKEPGAKPAAKKKPKVARRTQPKRSDEAPLSVEAAYHIYQVKEGLARDACKNADAAWMVYEAIADKAWAEGNRGRREGKDDQAVGRVRRERDGGRPCNCREAVLLMP